MHLCVCMCVSNAVNMGQNLGLKARDLTPCGLNVCGWACSHIFCILFLGLFCSIHSIESFLSPETMLTKHSDGFLQLPMTFSDSFCLTLTSAMCTLFSFSFAIIRYSLIITFRRNNVVMVKKITTKVWGRLFGCKKG